MMDLGQCTENDVIRLYWACSAQIPRAETAANPVRVIAATATRAI
jgi:hypothetical protein